jgi:hypothetical protein
MRATQPGGRKKEDAVDPLLQLHEDTLAESAEFALPARPRMIFVVHGAIDLADRALRGDEALAGENAMLLTAGRGGATIWRWELVGSDNVAATSNKDIISREKLCVRLETLPLGALLLRGDSVAFPPGGCAYLHRHQGPGIRCLIEGGIRIDTRGRSTSYGPGSAWYESGPEPVFAQAADRPTRFVRVMILPIAYLARSSVEYLNEEDKAKPKTQTYKIYADMPITDLQR